MENDKTEEWDEILSSPLGLEVFEELLKKAKQEVEDGDTEEDK